MARRRSLTDTQIAALPVKAKPYNMPGPGASWPLHQSAPDRIKNVLCCSANT